MITASEMETLDDIDLEGMYGDDNLDWLELTSIPESVYNPLLDYSIDNRPDPVEEIVGLMMNTSYLHFAAKHILNVQLLPFQLVILDTLWEKKMPLLVATRGAGKSFILAVYTHLRLIFHPGCKIVTVGASFRQAKGVFDYMCDIWDKAPVLRDIAGKGKKHGPHRDVDRCEFRNCDSRAYFLPTGDGCLSSSSLLTYENSFGTIDQIIDVKDENKIEIKKHNKQVWGNKKFRTSDEAYYNGIKPTKKITTEDGYSFEATYNHKMKVLRNGNIEFIRSDEMKTDDYLLIDRSYRWHNGSIDKTLDECYSLGFLIGDGCWTDQYKITFATHDHDVLEHMNKCGFTNNWKLSGDGEHYLFYGKEKISNWLSSWNMPVSYAIDKKIPSVMMSGNREQMRACLQGLFDSDGGVSYKNSRGGIQGSVTFYNTSEILIDQVQYLLLHYGIISQKNSRQRNNEKWAREFNLNITGNDVVKFYKEIGFRINRKAAILDKLIADKKKFISISDGIPDIKNELLRICSFYQDSCKTIKSSKHNMNDRVSYNIIACKKVITREYLKAFIERYESSGDKFINNLKEISEDHIFYSKIKHISNSECMTYDIHVPEEHEYCANGFFSHNTKIRGLRANYILVDEAACLGKGTLVETDRGLYRIEDFEKINYDYKLYTGDDNQKLESPSMFIKTPLIDTYKITLSNGYSFKCSNIHQVMTLDGWKLAKDLSVKDRLIFKNEYKFPEKKVIINDIELDNDLAWILGILISEGAVNDKYSISVNMTDKKTIEKINNLFINKFNLKSYISYRKAYIDPRGWDCKETWAVNVSDKDFRNMLFSFGLKFSISIDKVIPDSILRSPKDIVISFLSGLYLGDGSCFQWKDRNNYKLGITYYSASEQLVSEVQMLTTKMNLIGSKSKRKSKISNRDQWMFTLQGEDAKTLFDDLKIEKWKDIDKDCFIYKKSEYEGCIFDNSRNKWQARIYCNGINNFLGRFNSKEEALKCIKNNKHKYVNALKVVSVELQQEKENLYDFLLPNTHSFYGNGFRQHNSVPEEILNVVVKGFGMVASGPVDKVKEAATVKKLKKAGLWTPETEALYKEKSGGNQILLSGTAYYSFNHFYRSFKTYHDIIKSKGNVDKLKEIMQSTEEEAQSLDWKSFAVLRVPYTAIPEGFLDKGIIAQSKATLSTGQFYMELGACFSSDSNGFYKRSIIEEATVNKPITTSTGTSIQFNARKSGDPQKMHVIAVDPAADQDNAAIVVLELNTDHRKILHCWTTNRKRYNKYKEYMKSISVEVTDDYYRYIAKKIRQLMREFNTERVIMDKNGGGIAISEALASKETYEHDEIPVYPVINLDDPKFEDSQTGLHILELLTPNGDFNSEANHGMLKDLQDKVLLFPMFDTVEMAKSLELDKHSNIRIDTYEKLVQDIEEIKNEMTTIVCTASSVLGKEVYDTPEVKSEGMKKGRLRKDRYSALLYANFYARNRNKQDPMKLEYKPVGATKDFGTITPQSANESPYHGYGMLRMKNNAGNYHCGTFIRKS